MRAAIVICNGSVDDYSYYRKYFERAEFIICADGGAVHARRFGIRPDVLLGDFDSIPKDDLDYYKDLGVHIIEFSTHKDMTDTEIAVDLAIERGYDTIIIIGGIGTRLDHSLSNIFMLKRIQDKGVRGIVVNEHNEITIINDRIELKREENVKVTLLPVSEKVEGVTTQGLYYPLDNATLELGSTWGVSNEFQSDAAVVTIKSGLMLVIKARD